MTLLHLNTIASKERATALFTCCGSTNWVNKLNRLFPFENEAQLLDAAHTIWENCSENDWLESFQHHPKIGDMESLRKKFASTAQWAAGEQAAVAEAESEVLEALANGNEDYEKKFGYIFIVCATGKSAKEMLQLLHHRLPNPLAKEIHIAMNEQMKITFLRLKKLLA
jgi:2-oxo-4-hydroxy-4-carboxy-5-ureidoimidazoline decarboxylase